MEARSQKIRGLNLNPFAPAKSKRTFAFSGKTSKNMKKQCNKEGPKMEARSQKKPGPDLNPLAPAQSKRTFAFSGKTQQIISSLFRFFFAPFSRLFGKIRKTGPGSVPRATKARQNGPQGRQNGAQESTIYAPRSHQVQTPAAGCSPKAT